MASSSELEKQIGALCLQNLWSDAFTLCREHVDRFLAFPGGNTYATGVIIRALDQSSWISRLEQEAEYGSASSDLLLAVIYQHRFEIQLMLKHLERGATRGHPLAMLEHAMRQTPRDAFQWYLASAQAGCSSGMYMASRCLEMGCGCDQDTVQAGLWLARATQQHIKYSKSLHEFRLRYPQECIPYGIWRPEPIYQMLLPTNMRQALFTWLLVARRRRLARYVALLVCSFIVTRSGW